METPSSIRRVTRSSAANNGGLPFAVSRKLDESEKGKARSVQRNGNLQQQDRSALIDITNDSPIIGLAMGNLVTPSSVNSKKKATVQSTPPGSGEALLRCQVKSLLQKVEEEGEPAKILLENRPLFNVYGLAVNTPMPIQSVAPTPANTPQVFDLSGGSDCCLPSATPVTEKILIPQMMKIEEKQEEDLVTRSLLLDFTEKSASSGGSCSQGGIKSSGEKLSTDDEDSSSIWSIQANASSTVGEEDDEEESGEWLDQEDYYDDEQEEDESELNELCEGMNKMSFGELPKFTGKHIRFVYNSDDEIAGEEDMKNGNDCGSEE